MTAQKVPLTEHGREFVDAVVKRGEHESAAEVEAFRRAAQAGPDDLDNGRYTSVPFDELDDFIAALGRRAAQETPQADRD